MSDREAHGPVAVERSLPWNVTLRGLRWGDGPDGAHLLHEPGADIDAWKLLPVEMARQLAIETVAVDLPGHGLSDDPWEPARLRELLRDLPAAGVGMGRRFLIAAGATATAAIEEAPGLGLSGLVCLSPDSFSVGAKPPRTAGVPKLFVAGSLAGNDLEVARGLAAAVGGWSVVTSLPVTEQGTSLLDSAWGGQLVEQVIAFLRDCQRRPVRSLHRAPIRPGPPTRSPEYGPTAVPDESGTGDGGHSRLDG